MATTKEMLALETLLIYFACHGRGAAGRLATRSGHVRGTGSTTGKRRPSAMYSAPVTG